MIYVKQREPHFWKSVRENAGYRDMVKDISDKYEELFARGVKPLTREAYDAYFETGDRAPFEKDYFSRRALLERAFILALLYPENDGYIATVHNVISAICDEYSWVVPAHSYDHKIDLFSSETALIITECISFLGDRLSGEIKDRGISEVKRRVIDAYEANKFIWEKYSSNWSSVCSGCIAIAMMYEFPQALKRNIDRIIKTQELFLSGYSDDGICFEGPVYWIYGFGNFVWLADALLEYSNGKYDLFSLSKAKAVAAYPNYAVMCGGAFVSFSDSSRKAIFEKPLLNCIKSHYPDIPYYLAKYEFSYAKSLANMQNFILRNFFFGGLPVSFDDGCKDFFLPSAGQMIFNRENYSFAVKAGNNAELHNHNDIGSFIFSDSDGQALCDLGVGYYNRDYFSEKRYDILCTSSLGHSVPIIDGQAQKPGRNYCGTILCNGDTVVLDIKNAYEVKNLESLTRTVMANDSGVVITDICVGNVKSFIDRFVTLREPEVSGGNICLGKTVIRFDNDMCELNISTAIHKAPRGDDEKVYLLDFKARNIAKPLVFNLTVNN